MTEHNRSQPPEGASPVRTPVNQPTAVEEQAKITDLSDAAAVQLSCLMYNNDIVCISLGANITVCINLSTVHIYKGLSSL